MTGTNLGPVLPDTPMRRAMAEGHLMRCGHPLIAHWEPSPDYDFAVIVVRDCCTPEP